MIKLYYNLTKPGIIYGNAVTIIAGFFLAAQGRINLALLLSVLIGLSLIIASGCVFNNVLDRKIDARMERTKNRALVTGKISQRNALIYATILGLAGAIVLFKFTNFLTLAIALFGLFVYVGLYTPLKRRTVYGTLIGAVAGAVPPVVGYTTVTNRLDLGAWLLFLILVCWQMPHFYAIAIRRLDEYKSAAIPVLPVVKGSPTTKFYMLYYFIAFIFSIVLLAVFGYAGLVYLVIMVLISLYWFWLFLKGFRSNIDEKVWAKKVFLFSLVVIFTFSLATIIDSLIKIKL